MNMANTYNGQTAKLIATIAQSMPELTGEQMQYWIKNPAIAAYYLRKTFLPDLPVWKTITLTGHKTVKDLVQSVETAGYIVTDKVKRRLYDFRTDLGGEERQVDLVLIHGRDLGLPRAYPHLCSYHMKALGFECVTPEIAMTLRARYINQSHSCEDDVWAPESPQGPSELDSHFYISNRGERPEIDQAWSTSDGRVEGVKLVYVKPRK